MFGRKDNVEISSREYLSADTFEEWLMLKHGITEDDFEALPHDTQNYYRDEYASDMDFAGFVSGDGFAAADPETGTDDEDCEENHEEDTEDPGGKGISVLKMLGTIIASAAAIASIVFLFNRATSPRLTEPYREYGYRSENYGDRENDDDSIDIKEQFIYHHLTPGQPYILSTIYVDEETGQMAVYGDGTAVGGAVAIICPERDGETYVKYTIEPSRIRLGERVDDPFHTGEKTIRLNESNYYTAEFGGKKYTKLNIIEEIE